jgi:arylformamidase
MWHFFQDGSTIDKEPLGKFVGQAVIADLSRKPMGVGINGQDLDGYAKAVKDDDILLIYTGTDDSGKARTSFTYLETSAAEWLVRHGVKCVGIDTLSVEKYGSKRAPVHRMLLSNGIGIIENLGSNLKQFAGKRMFLVCLPLPLQGVDGSPARAILFDIKS